MLPPCKKCEGLQVPEYVSDLHAYAIRCFICGARRYPVYRKEHSLDILLAIVKKEFSIPLPTRLRLI